jgi:hypothetical protein
LIHGAGELFDNPIQKLLVYYWYRERLTHLPPTREIPLVRKSAALLGLDGMNPTGITF